MANAIARCWGNCAVDMLPVQELGDSYVFTASFKLRERAGEISAEHEKPRETPQRQPGEEG
jgi:hypothetical protein